MSNHRIPLGVKLAGGFAVVLALMVALGVVGITKISAVSERASRINDRTVPSVGLASQIQIDAEIFRQDQFRHMASTDAGQMRDIERDLAEDRAAVAKSFRSYAPLAIDKIDQDSAARARREWTGYVAETRGFRPLSARNENTAASAVLTAAQPRFDKLETALTSWKADQAFDGRATNAEADATAAGARTLTLILLAVALMVGAAIATILTRSLLKGVRAILASTAVLSERSAELRDGLDGFAEGDLTRAVGTDAPTIASWSNDELGDVAQATNAVRDSTIAAVEAYNASRLSLSGMIGEVTSATATLSATSEEMAATSEEAGRAVQEIATAIGEVAIGAERQVVSVQSVRERVELISEAAASSASGAQDTAQAAEDARAAAEDGTRAADEATAAMTSMRAASEDATAAIDRLGGKSTQIGGIVATISGIAEQTNLLALNAAIEAARAGDQGRGFAVVADEVRKLAEESQEAAATIGRLIEEIQSETTKAVDVVAAGGERTAHGEATVAKAREAFVLIGRRVEDVTERVLAIAATAGRSSEALAATRLEVSEVAGVAEQTSASSEQVSASAEQTSASAQEIAASSQSLATTAEQLARLVERFQVAAR